VGGDIPTAGIGLSAAGVRGSLSTLGGTQSIDDCGFIWSAATIADGTGIDDASVTKISCGAKTELSGFISTLSGLSSETEYFVRPYVTVGANTYLGAEQSFTTPDTDTVNISFENTAYKAAESSGSIAVKIIRSSDTSGETTVDYATGDITAAAGSDYTAASGTLTFAAGETEKTITLNLTDDTDYETDKTFKLTLSNPSGSANIVGGADVVLTIANDDAPPAPPVKSSECAIKTITIAGVSGSVNEAAKTVSLTVSYGTSLKSIAPSALTISDKATISPSVGELRDFSSAIAYTVTAEDGTTARYFVTVSVTARSSDATLGSLTVRNSSGGSLVLSPSFSADTTEYTLSAASDTSVIDIAAAANYPGAAAYVYLNDVLDTTPDSISLSYGTNNIKIIIRAEDGTEKTYRITVTRAAAPTSSDADLTGIVIKNGTLSPAFNKDVVNYNVNVANSVTKEAVTPTLSDSSASYTMLVNGVSAGSGADVSINVGANVFTIVVTATDGTQKTYAISVSRADAPSDGGGVGGGSPQGGSNVPVTVGDSTIKAGTQTTGKTEDGREETTVTVDNSLVDAQLNTSGSGARVLIPVSGSQEVKGCSLTGEMVQKMENNNSTLQIQTENVTYSIAASQINIKEAVSGLGSDIKLSDVTVKVKIENASAETAGTIAKIAGTDGFAVIVAPVEFSITVGYGDKTATVDSFTSYVTRTVAIPDYVDPARITTAVVIDDDGSVRHVPTRVVKIDGHYYAEINSLTNSTYAIIYNQASFTDISAHWAESAINDMGSRKVVTGVGNNLYAPDRSITRAEFAAVIVRAMGLSQGTTESEFTDVALGDWFNGYVDTAAKYGLITGYDSLSYGPNGNITREQAMAVIARAMKLTGLSVSLTANETDALLAEYTDSASISDYSNASIAACVKAGIVIGTCDGRISPKGCVTRAELAVMVSRLLQKSELI
ncbi:MAG: S-layer homology domain-containing protein, partial [Oscillospiraceae bacterium]